MAGSVIPFPRQESGEPIPAQIYLQPLAAPSILGLYGFAGATFMVAAHMRTGLAGRAQISILRHSRPCSAEWRNSAPGCGPSRLATE